MKRDLKQTPVQEAPNVYRALYYVTWNNNANPIVHVEDFKHLPTEKEINHAAYIFQEMSAQAGWNVQQVNHFATVKHYLLAKSNLESLDEVGLETE